ncbi:SDR family NAD(P)-dependent oxidoreductase [Zhongshania aliphaticivorans]|jgi:NAD(P)-dependent dehydrogenase (short-subunit alcohol dehydrogenase family)|uniref:SDR family NAD(P)-dependent oxidoreductase n=1 Tax=Zhongshania aliphaticivorans TaxID=1470434 RepID=UPI0012E57E4E|nr:SDR family NAD(P)-dependent oxidoreductase [Zhongshania aliphaticivorans]MBQ0759360.1 SDR family NAD(P)-dependent oxidoreductase [Zhongshania sp.]CAA0115889.1 Oxidoreductase UcpA [Zhongshania aliphaticivorans]
MTNFDFNKKVVFITGAAGGIGAACAREFYRRGASVVLADLGADALEKLASEFDADRVLLQILDVTDMDATKQVVANIIKKFGRIDIVFANAGVAWQTPKTIATADEIEFERIIEIDLLGVWRTVRAALPEVIKAEGQVLVTSSLYAFANGVINAPYAMSKAGVESFGRSLRAELAGTGATASVLYPGWIKTPMTRVAFGANANASELIEKAFPAPLRQLITPEVVASAVARGLGKRAPRIIVPNRWAPLAALRGLLNMYTDRMFDRRSDLQTIVRRVETDAAND